MTFACLPQINTHTVVEEVQTKSEAPHSGSLHHYDTWKISGFFLLLSKKCGVCTCYEDRQHSRTDRQRENLVKRPALRHYRTVQCPASVARPLKTTPSCGTEWEEFRRVSKKAAAGQRKRASKAPSQQVNSNSCPQKSALYSRTTHPAGYRRDVISELLNRTTTPDQHIHRIYKWVYRYAMRS